MGQSFDGGAGVEIFFQILVVLVLALLLRVDRPLRRTGSDSCATGDRLRADRAGLLPAACLPPTRLGRRLAGGLSCAIAIGFFEEALR